MYYAEIYRLKRDAEEKASMDHFTDFHETSGQTLMDNVESGRNEGTVCLNFDIQSAVNEVLLKDRNKVQTTNSAMRCITRGSLTPAEASLAYGDIDSISGIFNIDEMYVKSSKIYSTITDSSSDVSRVFAYPEQPLQNDAQKHQTSQSRNLMSATPKKSRNTLFEKKVKTNRGSASSKQDCSFVHTEESMQQGSPHPNVAPDGSKRRAGNNDVACCSLSDDPVFDEISSETPMEPSCKRVGVEYIPGGLNLNPSFRQHSIEKMYEKSPKIYSTITDSSSDVSIVFAYHEQLLRNDAQKHQTSNSRNLTSATSKPLRNTLLETKVKTGRGSAFSKQDCSFVHTEESRQQGLSHKRIAPAGSKRRASNNDVACCSFSDGHVFDEISSETPMEPSCKRESVEYIPGGLNLNPSFRQHSIDKMHEKSPKMYSTITDHSSDVPRYFTYPEQLLRNDAQKHQTSNTRNSMSETSKPSRNTLFETKVKTGRGSASSKQDCSFVHTEESRPQGLSHQKLAPAGSKRRASNNDVACHSLPEGRVFDEIPSETSMEPSCKRVSVGDSSDSLNANKTCQQSSNERRVEEVAVHGDNGCREHTGCIDGTGSSTQCNLYSDSAFHVADNCQVSGGNGEYIMRQQPKSTLKPAENEPMDQLAMRELIARLKEEIPSPKRHPMPMVTTRCNDVGQHVQCLNIEAFLLRLFDHYEDDPELLVKLAEHDDINFVVSKIREGGNIPNHMNVCVDLLVTKLMTMQGDCQDLMLYIYSKLLYIFVIFERDYKTAWHLCEGFLLFYPHGCGIRSLDALFHGAEAVLQLCVSDSNAVTVSLDALLGRGSNEQMCSLLKTILRM